VVKEGEKLEKKDGLWHGVCMQNKTREPMQPSDQFCPNTSCSYGAPPAMKMDYTYASSTIQAGRTPD
jgi:hypothetical protein